MCGVVGGTAQVKRDQAALFALGTTSLLLTRELNQHLPSSLSSSEQTTAEGAAAPVQALEASVLIVDRSLDFVAPSLATDHPLDVLLARAARADANAAAATSSVNALPRPLSPPLAGSAQGGGGGGGGGCGGDGSPPASGRRHPRGVPPPPPPPPRPPVPPALLHSLGGAEPACASLFDAVLTRRSKEVGQQLLKGLASVADDYETEEDDEDEDEDEDDEGVGAVGSGGGRRRRKLSVPARPTSANLHELLDALGSANRIGVERCAELQAARALLEASDTASASVELASLVSHQKLLQYTANSESAQAAFTQLISLFSRANATQRGGGESGVASSTGGFAADGSGEPGRGRIGRPRAAAVGGDAHSLLGPKGFDGDEVEEASSGCERRCSGMPRDPSCGGLLAPHAQRVPLDRLGAEA